MKISLLLILSLCFSFLSSVAGAQTCGQQKLNDRTYKYCVSQGQGAAQQNVLWYFHGIFEDERRLWTKKEINKIQEGWKKRGIPQPTIIAISLGGKWLAKENITTGKTSIANDITTQILPYLEKTFVGQVRQRMVLGKSMGGFNALQSILRTKVRIDKVAFVCPAFFPIHPNSTKQEVEDYKKRHLGYIKSFYISYVQSWTKKEFPSESAYAPHHPYRRVADLPKTLPVFLSVGGQDSFGFNEGTEYLAAFLKNRNQPIVYKPIAGSHCAYDVDELSAFLDFR